MADTGWGGRRLARCWLAWLALGLVLTWPLVLNPAGGLLGHPDVDVWNHAWGYWYVADALGRGELPIRTTLVSWPEGGALWFIDTLGALWALPLTWGLGPAVGYNAVQVGRIAAAGLAGQLLSEELFESRAAGWLAGAAAASTPFVLCELYNGITEVAAVAGVSFTLWAAARALRLNSLGSWALLGLLGGLTSATTFYYGLTVAILVALLVGWKLVTRQLSPGARTLAGLAAAGVVAACVAGPVWLAFHASLTAPDALAGRTSARLEPGLLMHNAVDPRTFFLPGRFQSVDLARTFGQSFLHTGYLRWTLLVLAGLALARERRARPWGLLALCSLLLGLGENLFWNGDFATWRGEQIPMPFHFLRLLLPELAISHPLRLSVGAQAIVPVLASGGLATLLGRLTRSRSVAAVAVVAVLAVGETLFASAARWPLAVSSAEVPSAYDGLPPGPVLDLPAVQNNGMATQRYFWFQTAHGHPSPWPLDIQMYRSSDRIVSELFRRPPTARPGARRAVAPSVIEYLRTHYSGVIVHQPMETQRTRGVHQAMLGQGLGAPEQRGDRLVWPLGGAGAEVGH